MARRRKEPDKLSRDAAAATAAGMTYGKYMAMKYPVTVVKPRPRVPDGYGRCKWCDAVFKKGIHNRNYCSAECRKKSAKVTNRLNMRYKRGKG